MHVSFHFAQSSMNLIMHAKKKGDCFCSFKPVEENPLGIPINIKVSKTHLCSVSDQFVTQRNGITKILLRTNLNVHKMLL